MTVMHAGSVTWSQRRLRAWAITLLAAMCLGALVPTVSRAWARFNPAAFLVADVCSADARTTAQRLSPSWTQTRHDGGVQLDHCPLCLLAAQRAAPPPQWPSWQAQSEATDARPEPPPVAIRVNSLWRPRVRGPPFFL